MRRTFRWVALSVVALLLLTGCGAGGSSTTAGESNSRAPAATAFTPAQLRDILQCLKGAGLSHFFPAPSPSPGDGTSTSTTYGPGGGGGPVRFPAGATFSDPKVVKALRLCRITLPSIAPGG
jgi:hypothetical protein